MDNSITFDFDNCDKLMIVAHPDDETFWGGYELLTKGYFVVCVTNGYNEKRKTDFLKIIQASGNKGAILNFKDTISIKKFKSQEYAIKDVLTTIINAKNWSKIITHNPKGEYGHPHHKLISQYVTDICSIQPNYFPYHSRFYFWFRKSAVDKDLKKKKLELINIYKKSQFIASWFFRYSLNII